MNKLFAIILAVAAISGLGQAQEPEYRAEFPKGDTNWTILFTKPEKDPGQETQKAPHLKQMDVVRRGDLRRDILVWSDGVKSEHWWSTAGNEVFFENRGNTEVRAVKASQKGESRYDETFFAWVGKQTYAGERNLDGKNYWYFETKYKNEGTEQNNTLAAWVDPKTAWPYCWSDGDRKVYFEFKPLDPNFRLDVPPKFAEAIARYNAYRTPPTRLKRR
jgi:hypothetical protein